MQSIQPRDAQYRFRSRGRCQTLESMIAASQVPRPEVRNDVQWCCNSKTARITSAAAYSSVIFGCMQECVRQLRDRCTLLATCRSIQWEYWLRRPETCSTIHQIVVK